VVPVESVPFFTGAIEWIAKAYPEAKTMAHVAQDDLIGIEGATYTYAGAKANNIKVVYDKFFAPETQDFAPIVSAMLAKKPDIINLGCSYVEYVDLIVEQCYKQGFKGILTAVEFRWNLCSRPSTRSRVTGWRPEKLLVVSPGLMIP
jgi:branched-chain amino acid transport system substrate-binding protein